jgi:hypothetical protein
LNKNIEISNGSLNQTVVHPPEVFNQSIYESASAIKLIHNHPSGDPSSSRADFHLTEKLVKGGELLGLLYWTTSSWKMGSIIVLPITGKYLINKACHEETARRWDAECRHGPNFIYIFK